MSLARHQVREVPGSARRPFRCRVLLTEGFDGVVRVASLLRQRGCVVLDFATELTVDDAGTALTCTLAVTDEEARLWLLRLERLPTVLSATPVPLGPTGGSHFCGSCAVSVGGFQLSGTHSAHGMRDSAA
jgi:hypothetical protein